MLDLDYYKEVEGIKSTERDDQLDLVIEGVNSIIRSYLGHPVTEYASGNGVTETFNIQWDTHVVQLKYSPVLAILKVEERCQRGDYVELFSENTSPAGYDWYFDGFSDSLFRTNEWGAYSHWAKGVGSVRVQYLAGYETVPKDLLLAAVDLTNYYLKDEYKSRFTVGSNTVESPGTSSLRDASFPDHIKRILDVYRLI